MRRKGYDDFLIRMSCLNVRNGLINRLLAAVFISRAKAEDQNGVFISDVLHSRVVVRADTDFSSLL